MNEQIITITQDKIERIVSIYNTFAESEINDAYFSGVMSGMERLLTALDILIEGINTEEGDDMDAEDNETIGD